LDRGPLRRKVCADGLQQLISSNDRYLALEGAAVVARTAMPVATGTKNDFCFLGTAHRQHRSVGPKASTTRSPRRSWDRSTRRSCPNSLDALRTERRQVSSTERRMRNLRRGRGLGTPFRRQWSVA
jgi:hypothetical protein